MTGLFFKTIVLGAAAICEMSSALKVIRRCLGPALFVGLSHVYCDDKPSQIVKHQIYIWGENENSLCTPLGPSAALRIPIGITLPGEAGRHPLRHFSLSRKVAAAVDWRGDVWEWGYGTGFQAPVRVLKGQDVKEVKIAEHQSLALTNGGDVMVLRTDLLAEDETTQSEPSLWQFLRR